MHVGTSIQLKTPIPILPATKVVMERHGCLVEDGRVTLPVGSRRRTCLQIVTITLWYEIILPDQYQLLEAYDWRQAISMLYLQPEEGRE